MITKPEEHDVNRAGKRVLREALEPLGWVVNDVQEDYGIDSYVQVFDGKSPTGSWFHVQLKSSANSNYIEGGRFVSQELSFGHARHYASEMREPVILIHVDVNSKTVYWHTPQLDSELAAALNARDGKTIAIRIPTEHKLPATAPTLLASLEQAYLTLANRALTAASMQSFGESLKHFPNQQELYRAFQDKHDVLKLNRIEELFEQRKLAEVRARVQAVLDDPDSDVQIKFWARMRLHSVDFTEAVHAGKPQSILPKLTLEVAKSLQALTKSGPKHLKFYSLILKEAAELEILVHESYGLFLTIQQHVQNHGNPIVALGLYTRRLELTRRIIVKYNRCLRLARYAASYPDRWALGRAMTSIVNAVGGYLITLNAEKELAAARTFERSALQICKVAAWIGNETGDPVAVELAAMSALVITRSEDSDAYRWAEQVCLSLTDPEVRKDAIGRLKRAKKRWKGEEVEGDYRGDPVWQAIQNMSSSLGIDMSNEKDALVQGLRIAAKDDSPQRILINCEHLLVSQGAIGPVARRIQKLFNLGTAGSKVVHCTLHNFHVEGKEQDKAYEEFKRQYCSSCLDRKPRPQGWEYEGKIRQEFEARHHDFVAQLAGTKHGIRFTNQD